MFLTSWELVQEKINGFQYISNTQLFRKWKGIYFVFSKKFLISEITSQIRKTGKNLLEDVNLLDVFEDTKFGDDHISYTFRLSYRDKDKTLLDSDITSIHLNIISNVEKCFNTKLRD